MNFSRLSIKLVESCLLKDSGCVDSFRRPYQTHIALNKICAFCLRLNLESHFDAIQFCISRVIWLFLQLF